MLPDEGILHDGLSVDLQNLLEVIDVIVLVGRHQVSHRQDLRVVLVGLSFLEN